MSLWQCPFCLMETIVRSSHINCIAHNICKIKSTALAQIFLQDRNNVLTFLYYSFASQRLVYFTLTVWLDGSEILTRSKVISSNSYSISVLLTWGMKKLNEDTHFIVSVHIALNYMDDVKCWGLNWMWRVFLRETCKVETVSWTTIYDWLSM